MQFYQYLPNLYKNLLPESFFSVEFEGEKTATCSNCIMCYKEDHFEKSNRRFFNPDVKCCTFYPNIPNYLIGAILADNSPELKPGKEILLQILKQKRGVTPFGVFRPDKYAVLYNHLSNYSPELFGQVTSMACPYLTNGNCSIWKYRNAVCTTWFCKHDNGYDGKNFWNHFRQYLATVEENLSKYLLLKLCTNGLQLCDELNKYTSSAFKLKLSPEEFNEISPASVQYDLLWDKHKGNEIDFYLNCYKEVCSLKPNEVKKLSGIEGTIKLSNLKNAYKKMVSNRIPVHLRFNPELKLIKTNLNAGTTLVDVFNTSYELSEKLYNCLHFFTGELSLKQVQKELMEKKGLVLNKELILKLYKNRILTDLK